MSFALAAALALPSSDLIISNETFASTFGAVGVATGVAVTTAAIVDEAAGLEPAVELVVDSQAPTSKAADRTPMDIETFKRFFFIAVYFLPQLPSAVVDPAEGSLFC
jgi:hypothetical protein